MCLIVFALGVHPQMPLVVLANRDEYHARPSEHAHAWADAPGVFAGRDLEKGGTWLGITTNGRVAAVTNVRDPSARRIGTSRGALVREALLSQRSAAPWAEAIRRDAYPSFNLLVGTARELVYAQDARAEVLHVSDGIHGLSNARLDDPWPKVTRSKARLEELLARPEFDLEGAFALLSDRTQAPDDALPQTGVPLELERQLSAAFITMSGYGTRASTVVIVHAEGQMRFVERTFGDGGSVGTTTDVTMQCLVRP